MLDTFLDILMVIVSLLSAGVTLLVLCIANLAIGIVSLLCLLWGAIRAS